MRARESVTGDAMPVLWLCGPAGVGKSTIGFELYLRTLRCGLTAGYVVATGPVQDEAADLIAAATGWPG